MPLDPGKINDQTENSASNFYTTSHWYRHSGLGHAILVLLAAEPWRQATFMKHMRLGYNNHARLLISSHQLLSPDLIVCALHLDPCIFWHKHERVPIQLNLLPEASMSCELQCSTDEQLNGSVYVFDGRPQRHGSNDCGPRELYRHCWGQVLHRESRGKSLLNGSLLSGPLTVRTSSRINRTSS